MSKHPPRHPELPVVADDKHPWSSGEPSSSQTSCTSRGKIGGVLLLSFSIYACYWYAASFIQSPRPPIDQLEAASVTSLRPQSENWAQYSPYVPVEPYQAPPSNCEVTQVNILQRHGARYPTAGASKHIKDALEKLLSVREYTDPQLLFLRNFTYSLGEDDLVPFGASQSFEAGEEVFLRYAHLVNETSLPFVRASSEERVVMSATNWTAGFAAASAFKYNPKLSVVLSEEGNDTLDNGMCENQDDSNEYKDKWLKKFAPPIRKRLNKGAPHADLDNEDTFALMSLCPFETVATESRSGFCAIFEDMHAFDGYEYTGDLDKYYGTGYGAKLGRVQGVGYVNELLARLTNTPVDDHTQTNATLDADPATFPLGRALYADFSHDNQMVAIYTALGLFRPKHRLHPKHPDPHRVWRVSRMVPFSARMVVERLACAGRHAAAREYVRVLVNQALQPLEFCGAGDGLCTLDDFVKSQAYARNGGEGDWEKCF